MKKTFKHFICLFAAILCFGQMWGDAYTPTADEVIILNDVYSSSATDAGYSSHSAIAWGGSVSSTSSKKAGDPNNDGAATSSNVTCYSVKGNGGGKNITISITGCSKIIVYHESHASRYVELRSGSKSGTLIGKGSASTYYTEVNLTPATSYTIFLHGTTGSDDQDFNIYAVKLITGSGGSETPVCPSGLSISGTTSYTAGQTISLTAALSAGNGTITYTWYKGADLATAKAAGSIKTGTSFSKASCVEGDAGNYWCEATKADCSPVSNALAYTVTVAAAKTVADLVAITDDWTFTPSATIAAGAMAESDRLFAAGSGCEYNNGMLIKENRALAFKLNSGAKVKVTFTEKSDSGTPREMQLGTAASDDDNKAYGHSGSSPAVFDVNADGVVYLTASSDLRFSKLEIMYPHTVTYALNDGTGTTPTQASKYAGETFTAHDGTTGITAPAGKEFEKWKDQDNTDVAAGATYTMPAKNVTLTAQWRTVTVKYTVIYDLDDYTAGVAPTETNKAENDVITIKAAPDWTNHDFLGWLCDIDSKTYQAGDDYTMTAANTKFTAQWQAFFTITYKDGDETLGTEKVNAGSAPVGISDPTKELYSFVGWTLVGGSDLVNPATLTENTVLVAKWKAFDGCAYLAVDLTADATLNVDDNVALKNTSFGGSVKVAGMKEAGSIVYNGYGLYLKGGNADSLRVSIDHQMQVGSKITVALYTGNTGKRGLNLLNKNCGAVDGGTMLGWESATTGASGTFSYTVKADDGLDGEKMFHLQRNNSVYLMYITVEDCAPQDFTVTYKDGTSTMGTESVFENEHPTASGITTGKSGYVFEGWAETDGGSVVDLDDITITADKTLYAVYTERALTSVTLEDMNLKVGDTRTPAMTLNPEGALVTSQVWAITASTATGTTINAETGEITAGETAGQLTVQVTVNTDKVATCTVKVVRGFEAPKPVTETTTWNWATLAVAAGDGPTIANPDTVLANYLSGEEWETLSGNAGGRPYRHNPDYMCYQGTSLSFRTTKPGILTLKVGYTSSKNVCDVSVNGHVVGSTPATPANLNSIVVPAGEVYISATSMRIYSMTFDTDLSAYTLEDNVLGGYDRTVNAGNYGTICLPNSGVMSGASIFEIAYYDEAQTKIFFDEVVNGYMVAGRPYIFLPNEGKEEIVVYHTDQANAPLDDNNGDGFNGLFGFYDTSNPDAIQTLEVGEYFLYHNQYYVVDAAAAGKVAVGNYRAYIKLNKVSGNPSTPAPGRRRVSMNVNGKQVATDVENVTNANVPQKVLINGRMFIILGEKMYDVTGQIVK